MVHISDDFIEKLETLPSRQGKREIRDRGWEYHREHFPYDRAERWIKSKIGKHFDKVFAEWVKLEWIPVQYRNINGIDKVLDGVTYKDGVPHGSWGMPLWRSVITIDQKTKQIKRVKAPSRESWAQIQKKKLAEYCIILKDYLQLFKIKGIWYELKIPERVWRYERYNSLTMKWLDTPPRTPADQLGGHAESLVFAQKRQLTTDELRQHNLKNEQLFRNEPI